MAGLRLLNIIADSEVWMKLDLRQTTIKLSYRYRGLDVQAVDLHMSGLSVAA